MRKDIADKWIEALRSDEYNQGRGQLCMNDEYCCLGVLADLAAKEDVCSKYTDDQISYYDSFSDFLPDSVRRWAGMNSNDGDYGTITTLADKNDGGVSFKTISNIIEEVWPIL